MTDQNSTSIRMAHVTNSKGEQCFSARALASEFSVSWHDMQWYIKDFREWLEAVDPLEDVMNGAEYRDMAQVPDYALTLGHLACFSDILDEPFESWRPDFKMMVGIVLMPGPEIEDEDRLGTATEWEGWPRLVRDNGKEV